MSVIITNRNKPKDCLHCWNHYDCDYYLAEPVDGYIDKNCHLKSVNELIEEISRKANSGQWSDATVYGLNKAIAIIKEYCGMEEK